MTTGAGRCCISRRFSAHDKRVNDMSNLTVCLPNGDTKTIPFQGKPKLSELLAGFDGAPQLVCGGAGVCKKCGVAAEGMLEPPPEEGACLMCRTRVCGDAAVYLTGTSRLQGIETGGAMPPYKHRPAAGGYGAALDVGTTTVALRLIDLTANRTLCTLSAANPQAALAADVIGRIESALSGHGAVLQRMIRSLADELLAAACAQSGIAKEQVGARVVTGNTTMLYLFTGRSPKALSAAPFLADCLFGMEEQGVYYPPCPGAFVGADVACAVLASGMTNAEDTSMLIDLGTNGEIALWHNHTLHCCATAAGPAFEGGGISCGSASVEGAIDRVAYANGALSVHAIGDGDARSVCGSGLIDAAAALLARGSIDETGAAEEDALSLTPSVSLTPRDIRQLQLAKAAIAAGMQTLAQEAGVSLGQIKTLYIAGGFGRHLPLWSAVAIGLIPAPLAERTAILGNAALSGASLLLLDRETKRALTAINERAVCRNLAMSARFSDAFMERMMFEPVDDWA